MRKAAEAEELAEDIRGQFADVERLKVSVCMSVYVFLSQTDIKVAAWLSPFLCLFLSLGFIAFGSTRSAHPLHIPCISVGLSSVKASLIAATSFLLALCEGSST